MYICIYTHIYIYVHIAGPLGTALRARALLGQRLAGVGPRDRLHFTATNR